MVNRQLPNRRAWMESSGSTLLVTSAMLFGMASDAWATEPAWPSRTVKIIVPNPAGSATDTMARIVSEALSAAGSQPVVVENKPGAQGQIGVQAMKQGKPDGHTLIISFSGLNSSNPWLVKNPKYHYRDDFTHIVPLVRAPSLLVVSAESRFRSLADLLAFARTNDTKLTYGYGQATSHVMGAAFSHAGKFQKLTGVAYRGQPPALQDLAGDQFDFMFADLAVTKALLEAGKLRALGISTKSRSELVPNIPTLDEQGIRDYDMAAWIGLSAPSGMSPAIALKINNIVAKHVATPAIRSRIQQLGFTPLRGTPAQFVDFVDKEYQLWGNAIRAARIEAE